MCMFHYSHLQLGTYIIPFELYQYQIIPGAQKSSKKKVQKVNIICGLKKPQVHIIGGEDQRVGEMDTGCKLLVVYLPTTCAQMLHYCALPY